MVKQGIQIYARVKPTKSKTGQYELFQDEGQQESGIAFTVPRDMADGYINNKREVYQFRFNKVFNQASKQEEIFENVAQGVIDNVLAGYNGTIFAYGQTGSGKTFTITGGAERYSDRGLIPRSLSYIFEFYEQNSDVVHTTHVSYLEIYNENGYDLLDPKHEASKLEDLPKVNLLEDSDGNIHLKNLSLHPANNEEEALNLLFLGDTNRMIAETPMNQASTRSHCIFTIHISSRETGSATIRRAKLHLVDLAGSERVGKTNVGGTLLTEAKYINLSLHYLEQVIVALSEKSRSHIPYRNSMMTAVLRDSLGGNCMTTMIATCAVEKKNIDESISTCRFAQRVAMIKNDVSLNEEIDPKLMIAQLKKEIQRLKADLAMATGQEYTGELTEDDIERLKLQVKAFIEDTDTEASLNVGADMRKIEYCFLLLKEHALRKGTNSSPPSRTSVIEGAVDSSYLANQSEVSKLKELIKQRDNEINILVSMLKKEKKRAADADSALKHAGKGMGNSAALGTSRSGSQASAGDEMESDMYRYRPVRKTHVPERASIDTLESRIQPRAEERERTRTPSAYHKRLEEMSVGRKEAFEVFRRDYVHNDTIEENKKTLKQRYGDAKSLGEQVNTSRHRINVIKGQLEQHRVRRSMQGLVNGEENIEEDDPHEQRLKSQIEQEKATYKESFTKLRSMKTEIEHLQHLLEKAKVKMQKDFEIWWAEQASQTPSPLSQPPEEVKSAWRTPPISPLRAPQDRSRPNSANRRQGDNEERLPTSGTSKYAARLRAEAQLASSGVNHFLPSRTNVFNSSSENQRNGEGSLRSKTILSGEERAGQQNTAMSSRGSSNIPLTGDSRTDADIVAFMKARQNVLQQQGRR